MKLLGVLINAAASIYLALSCGVAAWLSVREGPDPARRYLAEKLLAGLSLLLAATLVRVLMLQSWLDIASFAAVFLIRMLVKAVLRWEVASLART